MLGIKVPGQSAISAYSETWELGTPKGLRKGVLNSEVVLFLRSIYTYWIRLQTEAAVLNSQDVPISQVVLKTGFTVYIYGDCGLTIWHCRCMYSESNLLWKWYCSYSFTFWYHRSRPALSFYSREISTVAWSATWYPPVSYPYVDFKCLLYSVKFFM